MSAISNGQLRSLHDISIYEFGKNGFSTRLQRHENILPRSINFRSKRSTALIQELYKVELKNKKKSICQNSQPAAFRNLMTGLCYLLYFQFQILVVNKMKIIPRNYQHERTYR